MKTYEITREYRTFETVTVSAENEDEALAKFEAYECSSCAGEKTCIFEDYSDDTVSVAVASGEILSNENNIDEIVKIIIETENIDWKQILESN